MLISGYRTFNDETIDLSSSIPRYDLSSGKISVMYLVIAPVPTPSSITILSSSGKMPSSICQARSDELGATAPTLNGFFRNAWRNCMFSFIRYVRLERFLWFPLYLRNLLDRQPFYNHSPALAITNCFYLCTGQS